MPNYKTCPFNEHLSKSVQEDGGTNQWPQFALLTTIAVDLNCKQIKYWSTDSSMGQSDFCPSASRLAFVAIPILDK